MIDAMHDPEPGARAAAIRAIGETGRDLAASLGREDVGNWQRAIQQSSEICQSLIEAMDAPETAVREAAVVSLQSIVAALRTTRDRTKRKMKASTDVLHYAFEAVTEILVRTRDGLEATVARWLLEPGQPLAGERTVAGAHPVCNLVVTGGTLRRLGLWWKGDPYDWLHRVIPDAPEAPRPASHWSDYEDERVMYVHQMQELQDAYLQEHADELFLVHGEVDWTGERMTACDIRGPYTADDVLEAVSGRRLEYEGPVPEVVRQAAASAVPFRLTSLLERARAMAAD